MTQLDDWSLGERIAFHRRRRGLSQREFAAELGRSESWVSQVERGARKVDRLSVQQHVADTLGIPLTELQGETDAQREAETSATGPNLEELRLTLSGHPALGVLFQTKHNASPPDLEVIATRVNETWTLVHASQFTTLSPILLNLIAELETTVRRPEAEERQAVLRFLTSTYQATATMFTRLGELDAAWVAADRAVMVAEQLQDPLQVVAGLFRMAHAFMALRQLDQAQHVASAATDVLRPRIQHGDSRPEELSLYGAMHLVQAIIAAREGDRRTARGHLDEARHTAERLGEDRDDYGTEFGPTNVVLHTIAVAVDVGDAGEAIDLAKDFDVSHLSPERQARFHMDVAEAHAQRRHVGDAVQELLRAEELAPEHVRQHRRSRETIQQLVQLSKHRIPTELEALAQRADVLT